MRSYLLLLLALTGCSSMWEATRADYVKASMQAYGTAASCCESFSEMPFLPWDGNDVTLNIDASSKAYQFNQGKSFFSALQLSPGAEGKLLRVKSLLLPGNMIPSSSMIYPLLTFLDNKHLIITTTEAAPRFYHSGVFSDLAGGGVSIVNVPERAAFVIIHTDPAKFRDSFNFSRSGGAGLAGGVYIPDSTYNFSVPYIPTGKVFLRYSSSDNP